MDSTYRDLAEAILTAHQRHRGGCLCGWGAEESELGKSHPAHVAAVLESAGALRTRPRD